MPHAKSHPAYVFAALTTALLALVAGSLLAQNDSALGTHASELKQGAAVERQLRGGASDEYLVKLQAGQYVRIIAEQRGIDVVVSLFSPAPALTPLIDVDSLNGRFGPEPLSWVVTDAGDYLVKVSSANKFAKAGSYSIRIADLRAAVPDDQVRIAGQRELVQGAEAMFEEGETQNLQQAISDFKLAYMKWAQVGDTERQVDSLAYLVEAYDELVSNGDHVTGTKVEWGDELAFLQKQANAGDASAQDALGDIYYDGLGVPQDFHEALTWKLKAANQNREDAQSAVGFDYFKAFGVRQDYEEALKWFRKAADNGFVPAQIKLGDMYTNAQGVKQDLAEAQRWYRMAADAGSKVAADRLNAGDKPAAPPEQ